MQAIQAGNARWSWSWYHVVLLLTFMPVVFGQYGEVVGQWKVSYAGNEVESGWTSIAGENVQDIIVRIYDVQLENATEPCYFHLQTAHERFAFAQKIVSSNEFTPMIEEESTNSSLTTTTTAVTTDTTDSTDVPLYEWQGVVKLHGRSVGYTHLFVSLKTVIDDVELERSRERLHVIVLREEALNKNIFNITASILALLMFANLGTALDMERLKVVLHKPIGPAIGFCMRYLLMPTLALTVGWLMLNHREDQQLALLFTALAPSGGLANISIIFLKGNINLVVASTAINCLLAIAMQPIWIIAIAPEIFKHTTLAVPFVQLALGTFVLIGAISIGALLRAIRPKTTQFVFKYLKPCCMCLSICLVALMVGLNSFVFQQLTWHIFFATTLLCSLAYLCSFAVSRLSRRTFTDSLTLCVETGVVNTTLPIVLLQYSLGVARADVVMIVPIMASLLSLCVIVCLYLGRRVFGWKICQDPEAFNVKDFYFDES